MQHKNRKFLKKDKGSIDAEEPCVDVFIKLMAINSWPLFCDNPLFVPIVENLFGMLLFILCVQIFLHSNYTKPTSIFIISLFSRNF